MVPTVIYYYWRMLRPLKLSCRLNAKLEAHGYPPMTSLVKDLSDGVRLIQLMVCSALCLPDLL